MKDFYNPSFELEALSELQGYSLQVFASGRVKLSFHNSHIQRYEYYAEWPKRDTEAFERQSTRMVWALWRGLMGSVTLL